MENPPKIPSANVKPRALRRSRLRTWLLRLLLALALLWSCAALTLVALRFVDPPTTAVHVQRRVQAFIHGKPYHERYEFIPLRQISLNLQHAVIAAEDGRFYQHHGFDWHAIELAAENDEKGGHMRGGSTLTQQLVKNLFFGTGRSFLRKGAESSLVPVAELVLGKQRILELYLNVVEWGPGIYGAEAASRAWDSTDARKLDREQAAQLAAILPDPRRRKPQRMTRYSGLILERMSQMNW